MKKIALIVSILAVILIAGCVQSPTGQIIDEDTESQEELECVSDWQCDEWSECINNQQTRNCIDTNNCGIVEGKLIESQSCTPECSLGYLEEYQCSGKWRQQKYQYYDCDTTWSNIEYCSYGCENGECKSKPIVEYCIEVANFHYNAEGNDNYNLNDEYVTLRNNCSESLDMTSWRVNDYGTKHTYIFPSFVLKIGSIVTLYTGTGIDTSSEVYWGRSYGAVWNNDGDTLFLRNADGDLILTYSY